MHRCHAHACNVRVPPNRFMCGPHWSELPKPLRDAIWREYRPSQESDKRPSARYMAVALRAVAELASGIDGAFYLRESEVWRKRAIDGRKGDPLEGVTA
jgi:hypothetical protein